jgi:hypothetical protein
MQALCLISGDHAAQLDHLAPLASLLAIPLYVTDPSVYDTALLFYPFTTTTLIEDSSVLSLLGASDFVFVSCKHYSHELEKTLKFFYKKSPRFCYCPHGHSDKGWQNSTQDLLQNQDLSLVYGSSMLEQLKRQQVLDSLQGTFVTGNYRLLYYLKHRSFYDNLASNEIFGKIPTSSQKILYAPTWQDGENNSSFFAIKDHLLQGLPKDAHLLIKLHPHLTKEPSFAVDLWLDTAKEHPNIHLIHPIPIVYPILQHIDALLCDISSLGYDFLYFDKPLFLFRPPHVNSLHLPIVKLASCSAEFSAIIVIDLFSNLEKNLRWNQQAFASKRQKLYAETFDTSLTATTFSKTLLAYMQQKIYEL